MKKCSSYARLLILLCAPLSLFPLRAAPPDEWHSATGGGGVEYRWSHGFEGSCHIEFRDSSIKNTSRSTQITGVFSYDQTTLNGIERNVLRNVFLTLNGYETSAGPDTQCQQINDVTISEFKRSS